MTVVTDATGYSSVPLALLVESPSNPRRHFDEAFLKELAESIRTNGLLQPLLVRPKNEHLEIVFGAQRYRAAQIAKSETVPVRIREMTDAQVLEAQLVENLQRRDVHPMEEAEGFRALLNLEEPKYSIEQIAAKTGKSPVFVATRLKLVDLIPAAVEAFYREEVGVGHALLLARLPPPQQEQALAACYQETYGSGKPKRVLLPVRHLQQWIEQNVLLLLKGAPFDRRDAELVSSAGSCDDCPKRTGHNKLLFTGISDHADSCSDPACWSAKLDAHVQKTVAAKPKLVQISTAFAKPAEGSPVVARNHYVELRKAKPKNKYQQDAPEFRSCKYATEAIVADGTEKGEIRRVCANPDCPVHHPKKSRPRSHEADDAKFQAEQEKRRREEAQAQATGLRVLKAIGEAVPVRLMKRDLLFVVSRLAAMLDERKLAVLIRQHGLGKPKDGEAPAKLLATFLPKAEESKLGRIMVESVILLSMRSDTDTVRILREAAQAYKVDVDSISAEVKQEFAAKAKTKTAKKLPANQQGKTPKKHAAA